MQAWALVKMLPINYLHDIIVLYNRSCAVFHSWWCLLLCQGGIGFRKLLDCLELLIFDHKNGHTQASRQPRNLETTSLDMPFLEHTRITRWANHYPDILVTLKTPMSTTCLPRNKISTIIPAIFVSKCSFAALWNKKTEHRTDTFSAFM